MVCKHIKHMILWHVYFSCPPTAAELSIIPKTCFMFLFKKKTCFMRQVRPHTFQSSSHISKWTVSNNFYCCIRFKRLDPIYTIEISQPNLILLMGNVRCYSCLARPRQSGQMIHARMYPNGALHLFNYSIKFTRPRMLGFCYPKWQGSLSLPQDTNGYNQFLCSDNSEV